MKLVDAFLAFLVLVGGLQFGYCVLGGNYVSLFVCFFEFFLRRGGVGFGRGGSVCLEEGMGVGREGAACWGRVLGRKERDE